MANTTWSTTDKTVSITLSGGNLTASSTGAFQGIRGAHGLRTGKYYWEVTATTWTSSAACGLANISTTLGTMAGGLPTSIAMIGTGALNINGLQAVTFGARANGDIVCFAIDFDRQLVWVRIGAAGNWNNAAGNNPATGVGGLSYLASPIGVTVLYPWLYLAASGQAFTANFGDTTFAGAATIPAGFTPGFTASSPPLIAASTQVALEHWVNARADARLTQIFLEHWGPAGTSNPQAVLTQMALEHWYSVAVPTTAQARAFIMA